MAEYINREELIKEINRTKVTTKTLFPKQSFCVGNVLTCIYTAPTADVVEVRQGHWYKGQHQFLQCSECDHYALGHTMVGKYNPNYCSHCGADMRGDNNG